jgi:hypothetical protein
MTKFELIVLFWVFTPSSLVDAYRCFGGTYRPCLQEIVFTHTDLRPKRCEVQCLHYFLQRTNAAVKVPVQAERIIQISQLSPVTNRINVQITHSTKMKSLFCEA